MNTHFDRLLLLRAIADFIRLATSERMVQKLTHKTGN